MKRDKLFEPYYKLGFNHFIYKNILGLRRPDGSTLRFYTFLIGLILTIAILF